MGIFTRSTAVAIGLANLAVLAAITDGYSALWRGGEAWIEALPFVLAAVVAGLATAEVILRRLGTSMLGEVHERRRAVMLAFCLGGASMGWLLGWLLFLVGALSSGMSVLDLAPVVLVSGLVGTLYGGAIGFLEGLILAPSLALVLGLLTSAK